MTIIPPENIERRRRELRPEVFDEWYAHCQRYARITERGIEVADSATFNALANLPVTRKWEVVPLPAPPPEPPAQRRGLPTVDLEAMGFDPAQEVRRLKQGGCCGQPSKP